MPTGAFRNDSRPWQPIHIQGFLVHLQLPEQGDSPFDISILLLFGYLVTSPAGNYCFHPKDYFPLFLKHCFYYRRPCGHLCPSWFSFLPSSEREAVPSPFPPAPGHLLRAVRARDRSPFTVHPSLRDSRFFKGKGRMHPRWHGLVQLPGDEQDRAVKLTSNFKSSKMTNYDLG